MVRADEVRADEAGVDAEQPHAVHGELAEAGDDDVRLELREVPVERVDELGREPDLCGQLASGISASSAGIRATSEARTARRGRAPTTAAATSAADAVRRARTTGPVEDVLGRQLDLAADVAVEPRAPDPRGEAGLPRPG